MPRFPTVLSTLAVALLALAAPPARLAAEEGMAPPPPPPPKENPDNKPPEPKEMDKAEKGKDKGAKRFEKKFGELEKEVADGPQRPPQPGNSALAGLRPLISQVNVVDRAALGAALAQYQSGKKDDALATADKVAQKSSDPDGQGVARLLLARLKMENGQGDEAPKLLRGVTGRAASLALMLLSDPLIKAGDADGLAGAAKELVVAQKNGLDRCRVVKTLLDLLDRPNPPGQGGGLANDARAGLMLQAAEWVTYEDALAAQAALSKEPPLFDGPGGPGMRGGMGGPGMAEMKDPAQMGELPGDLIQQFRDLKNVPPDQRKEAVKNLRTAVEERIKKLKAEGKDPDAARLQEFLDRLEERGKAAGNNKGDAKKKNEHMDPEKTKAEIKRLEDQGFAEEANKLKKQLEMQEKPVGDANENF